MNFRRTIVSFAFLLIIVSPFLVFAADEPILPAILDISQSVSTESSSAFLKPIFPPECECPGKAPDFPCVVLIINNLVGYLIGIGVLAIIVAIAYAGFLIVTNPSKPDMRKKGRQYVLNAIIGFVIVIGSFSAVDFALRTLIKPEINGKQVSWRTLLDAPAGAELCLEDRSKKISETIASIGEDVGGALLAELNLVKDDIAAELRIIIESKIPSVSPAADAIFKLLDDTGTNLNVIIADTQKLVKTCLTDSEASVKVGENCKKLQDTLNGMKKTETTVPPTSIEGSTCTNCSSIIASRIAIKSPAEKCGGVGACVLGGGCDCNDRSDCGTNNPKVSPPASSCMANSTLVAKLKASIPPSMRVTEAWPPTRSHQAVCHMNGTCVDVAFSSPYAGTNEQITDLKSFISSAKQNGLRVVVEANTTTLRDSLNRQGVVGVIFVSGIDGNLHASVYLD